MRIGSMIRPVRFTGKKENLTQGQKDLTFNLKLAKGLPHKLDYAVNEGLLDHVTREDIDSKPIQDLYKKILEGQVFEGGKQALIKIMENLKNRIKY